MENTPSDMKVSTKMLTLRYFIYGTKIYYFAKKFCLSMGRQFEQLFKKMFSDALR